MAKLPPANTIYNNWYDLCNKILYVRFDESPEDILMAVIVGMKQFAMITENDVIVFIEDSKICFCNPNTCSINHSLIRIVDDTVHKNIKIKKMYRENLFLLKGRQIVWMPNVIVNNNQFNIWRGWKAKPINNIVILQPILDFIKLTWTDNDQGGFEWFIDWLKSSITGVKNNTAIVLQSHYISQDIILQFLNKYVFGDNYMCTYGHTGIFLPKLKHKSQYYPHVLSIISNASIKQDNYQTFYKNYRKFILNRDIKVGNKIVIPDVKNYIIVSDYPDGIHHKINDPNYQTFLNYNIKPPVELYNYIKGLLTGDDAQNIGNAFLFYLLDREPINNPNIPM